MQVGHMSGSAITGRLCPKFHRIWGSGKLKKPKLGKFGRKRRPFAEKYFDLLFLPQLHGVLRVILEPLIRNLPIVGAVSMFFIRRPVREDTEQDGDAGKTERIGRERAASSGAWGRRAEGSGNCWMDVTMPACALC